VSGAAGGHQSPEGFLAFFTLFLVANGFFCWSFKFFLEVAMAHHGPSLIPPLDTMQRMLCVCIYVETFIHYAVKTKVTNVPQS